MTRNRYFKCHCRRLLIRFETDTDIPSNQYCKICSTILEEIGDEEMSVLLKIQLEIIEDMNKEIK